MRWPITIGLMLVGGCMGDFSIPLWCNVTYAGKECGGSIGGPSTPLELRVEFQNADTLLPIHLILAHETPSPATLLAPGGKRIGSFSVSSAPSFSTHAIAFRDGVELGRRLCLFSISASRSAPPQKVEWSGSAVSCPGP